MKKLISILLVLVLVLDATATTIRVNSRYFTSEPTQRRRTTLTLLEAGPVVADPWLIAGDSVSAFTDTNGVAYFSNVLAGAYSLTIAGSPGRRFPITVFDTNAVLEASALVNTTNYNTSFYTATQVDALLADVSGGSGSATNVYLAPGSARIAVTTNSAGNWSIDVPTGVTNAAYASAVAYAQTVTNSTGILAITAQQTNESALEAFLDLQDLQGAVTDAQVPNTISVDSATAATTAQGLTNSAYGNGLSYYEVTARWTFWNGDDVLAERYIASGSFQGSGIGISNINATNIDAGTIDPARLGSGSSITTKFLRGDSTWQTLGAGSGDMLAANNLSDVASTNAARTNIAAHNASNLTEGSLPDARLNSTVTLDAEIDTIAEVEAIWGRKVATNNATMTASTLLIGDGARGITTTTTGSGVLTALANTAGGASGFLLYDAELAALGGLTSAADKIPYFTGSGTAGLITIGSGLSFSGGTLSATGGGSQTPWTQTINGGGFSLTNVDSIQATGSLSLATLNATNFFIPGQSNGVAWIQSDSSVVATNETAIEAILDLQDLQGAVTDAQVPDNITVNLATTATTANSGDSATAFFSSGTLEQSLYPAALTNGATGVVFNEPFSIRLPGGGTVDWMFDILSGGGHSMTLGQTGSAAVVTFTDTGGVSVSDVFSGSGSGITNLPIVTSITIPMGAWFTNNVTVTDKTPASAVTATNSSDTFYFTDAITNVVHSRFALPYDWNAGVVRVGLRAFCTGTNSLSLTNTVWFVRAAAIGNGDNPSNPTWGTAVYMTNGLTTNSWTSREGITGDLTVGNTPTTAKSILWQLGRAGAAAGDSLTNSSVALEEVRVYLQRNTQTSFPTATP